jgi:Sulfatase/Transposase DDE domain
MGPADYWHSGFAKRHDDARGQATPTISPEVWRRLNELATQSTPWWPPRVVPPKGAPNVLLIITDDQGYGVSGTFGGVIPTPALDRIANAGLRYTQFCSTALCAPTRAALITGRNHHSLGFGIITELSTGFPGYDSITADVTRLTPVFERLRARFGIAQICVVADRGMISAATIAALEKAGVQYILGVRERSTKEVRNEAIEDDGVAVPLVIPRQKGETQLAIKEITLEGRRYVLCRNEEEARKDADRRAAILVGLDRRLSQGDKALVSNKGFRRFVKAIVPGNFSIDYDKVAAEAKFDGLFVLRTNTKLSALQVVLRYRNLLAVEDTFKTEKALLTTRPIFHKTDAAIRGHVFCSFLAVLLRKELLDRLASRRHGDLEWQHIVDDLEDLSEVDVEQDGRRALLRTAPGPTIDPICRALGITLPPVFQEMPAARDRS